MDEIKVTSKHLHSSGFTGRRTDALLSRAIFRQAIPRVEQLLAHCRDRKKSPNGLNSGKEFLLAGEITASADRYDKVIVGNYQVYATMYNIGDEVIDLCPDGIQMLVFALFRIWCKLQYISQPALPALHRLPQYFLRLNEASQLILHWGATQLFEVSVGGSPTWIGDAVANRFTLRCKDGQSFRCMAPLEAHSPRLAGVLSAVSFLCPKALAESLMSDVQ
ncbi:unnamed protein product, partial [Cladocopium goreaui]